MRVHALYLLKSRRSRVDQQYGARILGNNRVTVQRWLSEYKQTGPEGSARAESAWGPPSRDSALGTNQAEEAFTAAWGFRAMATSSTGWRANAAFKFNIGWSMTWSESAGVQNSKRPRPCHSNQDSDAVEDFPHRLMSQLRKAVQVAPDLQLRYWVEDESRLG